LPLVDVSTSVLIRVIKIQEKKKIPIANSNTGLIIHQPTYSAAISDYKRRENYKHNNKGY
jgi:hypothetical protein